MDFLLKIHWNAEKLKLKEIPENTEMRKAQINLKEFLSAEMNFQKMVTKQKLQKLK